MSWASEQLPRQRRALILISRVKQICFARMHSRSIKGLISGYVYPFLWNSMGYAVDLPPSGGGPICDEAARRAPLCHESSHRTHPAKIVEFSSIWKVVWRYLTSRPLIQIATQAPSPSSYSGLRRTARDAEGAGWGARRGAEGTRRELGRKSRGVGYTSVSRRTNCRPERGHQRELGTPAA